MSKIINQEVLFKNTSAATLYDLYMNDKKHSAATGSPAVISPKEGGSFTAYDKFIMGENLRLIKDQLIVQTWRQEDWIDKNADSVFLIALEQIGNDTVLHAVHANLPDDEAEDIFTGWHKYYWEPFKKYLSENK